MNEPPRPRRPPADELPEELRTLIAKARRPEALDSATQARLRRRLAVTARKTPPATRWWRAAGTALVAAAAGLVLWLTSRSGAPILVPQPEPWRPPSAAQPLQDDLHDVADPPDAGPPRERGSAPWYPVRNRCTDAVCGREPACCDSHWDDHCDELLLDAARLTDQVSGGVGSCYFHDRATCPDCACEYYLKVGHPLKGSVGFDQGTGCLRTRTDLINTFKQLCAQATCD